MHSLSTPSLLPVLVILRSDDNRPAHLALMGLRPMVVHSVEGGLKVLAERGFSAIVVDLELPQEDTLSFVSAVKDHAQTAHLPILALGCETATSVALAEDRGVDVVLGAECSIPSVFAAEVAGALRPGREADERPEAAGDAAGLDSPMADSVKVDDSGIFERGYEDEVTRVTRPSRTFPSVKTVSPKPRAHGDGAHLDAFSRSFAANSVRSLANS